MSFFDDEDTMRLVWTLAVYLNHDHQPNGAGRCAGCGAPSPCERQQAAQEGIDAVLGHAEVPVTHDPSDDHDAPVAGSLRPRDLAPRDGIPARRLCQRWWQWGRGAG